MICKKPASMKYTDLCIYIDENAAKIMEPGKYPEIESLVYNYLWLLTKALAIKKRMFQNFEDYDGYAFYAATRLFFAIRKSYVNQGKTIKGKQIKPIKSCLNYTKALLYPMKIEYQRETFKEVIEEEFTSKKFDAFAYKEQMKRTAKAASNASDQFKNYAKESLQQSSHLLEKILQKSPFDSSMPEYQNLKKSVYLTSIYILKTRKKLELTDRQNIILWHLPKNTTSYVKVLVSEFFTALKFEIIDSYKESDLDDSVLDSILKSDLEGGYFENQH